METLGIILIVSQLVFAVVASVYFYTNIKSIRSSKTNFLGDAKIESERLKKQRSIKLNHPLTEKSRPESFSDIVGQTQGIQALKAALCGPNPQHIIIYGPPGIGKTAAARVALHFAKQSKDSPFSKTAPFIEVDATISQFDERSIADPLIGSVHDPIYQGAGAYGAEGVPQPKPGAATHAHGGVLFIDEIGELHHVQMNKLLKVLEDRKVMLTSSYYSASNQKIPPHIHDIFNNGLPADFRLIGATTRRPEELPPALRSRCTEIFFMPLEHEHIKQIASQACKLSDFTYEASVPEKIANHASNGRDAVNMVQMAMSIAMLEHRDCISQADVEHVFTYGRYTPVYQKKVGETSRVGVVNGLAVGKGDVGMILEIEASIEPAEEKGKGVLRVTGIVEEEEINSATGKMRRSSTAKNAVENVLTLLQRKEGFQSKNHSVHVNFPGGMPVDGPSAGVAMYVALYSAIHQGAISEKIAMTGEVSIKGKVCPVGGVSAKILGAMQAGAHKVFIPKENDQVAFQDYDIDVICVETIDELIGHVFGLVNREDEPSQPYYATTQGIVSAQLIQ